MGLIHGSQPDALVLCHEPTREHMRGLPGYALPDIQTCIETNLQAARLTNPDVQCVGISVNTSALGEQEAMSYMDLLETEMGLPVVDPFRQGVSRIVEKLKEL
ncbi:EBNA-1 nuclear protein [Vibrio astriarenae]|nr:EBNA-1 nuclear protein [Vibrio sp. C7]